MRSSTGPKWTAWGLLGSTSGPLPVQSDLAVGWSRKRSGPEVDGPEVDRSGPKWTERSQERTRKKANNSLNNSTCTATCCGSMLRWERHGAKEKSARSEGGRLSFATYIHTHAYIAREVLRSRVAPVGGRAAGRRRAVTSKRPRPARPPAGPANEVDPKWTGSGPGPVQCDPVRSSAGPVLVRSTAIHCGRRTRPSERAGFGWPVGELCGVQFNNL